MEQIDFTQFDSIEALQQCIDAAEAEIARRKKQALEESRQRLEQEAAAYGLSLDEWLEGIGKKTGRPARKRGVAKKQPRVQ